MSLINASAADGGLRKTSGCDGCPDASAVSEQQLPGSGTLQFTAPESGSLRIVGLGAGGIGGGAGDINFALRLQGGVAEVREWGSYRAEVPFASGDTFTIAVVSGGIQYAKNGAPFFTSTAQATYALRVHVVLFNANAAVGGVLLSSTAPAAGTVPQAVADPGSADTLANTSGIAARPAVTVCATPRLWIRLCQRS
jgi:hypothetical protein